MERQITEILEKPIKIENPGKPRKTYEKHDGSTNPVKGKSVRKAIGYHYEEPHRSSLAVACLPEFRSEGHHQSPDPGQYLYLP